MRVVILYCHPVEESFNAAVRDCVMASLEASGNEIRLVDLYKIGFNPVVSAQERRNYHISTENQTPVAEQLDHIQWADALIFIYPTWWFGFPAMLKGWLDRVWVPHATFSMPEGQGPLKGNMTNIKKIAIITTCGASWLVSKFVGEPGRRTITRGLRNICCPVCETLYLAHYKMDTSTAKSRQAFLKKVEKRIVSFCR